jgi:hypothetical protein
MDIQDFFPIPAGGANVNILGASATIYTSDAWVG